MFENLNDYPVIITEPGEYIARNGKKVIIHEIKYPPMSTPGNTGYPCKGTYFTGKRGTTRNYMIYHVSGRAYSYRQASYDIVSKVVDK